MRDQLIDFMTESNRIEGIYRGPNESELRCAEAFLTLDQIVLNDVKALQSSIAPGKPLRDKPEMNVRVGEHRCPPGGREIVTHIENLLLVAQIPEADPWMVHCFFEEIHPFMDGNGRTGRLLWAWMMQRNGAEPFALPFLHRFYYQTLGSINVKHKLVP